MSLYDKKIKDLENTLYPLTQTLKTAKKEQENLYSNLASVKELFSKEFNGIISELSKVISAVEEATSAKDTDFENESPAAIKRMLNLNFLNRNSNTINNSETTESGYWCVQSEEILTGPFKCILHVDTMRGSASYWTHMFGIIKNNRTNPDNTYYQDSIVICANGYLAQKFSGSGAYKQLFLKNWVEGDTLYSLTKRISLEL